MTEVATMTAVTPDRITFNRADEHFRSQEYVEAERIWRGLIDHPDLGTEALFSAAASLTRIGRTDVAVADFKEVLKRDPTYYDAHYMLGCIYGSRGDRDAARLHFAETIRLKPGHPAATEKLKQLGETSPPIPTPPLVDQVAAMVEGSALPTSTPRRGSAAASSHSMSAAQDESRKKMGEPGISAYGAYEVLKESDDATSRNIIELMNRVNTTRSPRTSAFVDRILLQVLIGLMIAYVVMQAYQLIAFWFGNAADPVLPLNAEVLGIGGVIVFAVVMWEILVIMTTRYRIERGRIQVLTGIFARRWRSVEMFRLIDAQIDRSWAQLITGDATLVVVTSHGETRLVGLAPEQEMKELASRLLTIVFYLRTSSMVRGIII